MEWACGDATETDLSAIGCNVVGRGFGRYLRANQMFGSVGADDVVYTKTIEIDLASVEPCVSGPVCKTGETTHKWGQSSSVLLATPRAPRARMRRVHGR